MEDFCIVTAPRFDEEHGEVCPAGWRKGDAGMAPIRQGGSDCLTRHA